MRRTAGPKTPVYPDDYAGAERMAVPGARRRQKSGEHAGRSIHEERNSTTDIENVAPIQLVVHVKFLVRELVFYLSAAIDHQAAMMFLKAG